MSPNFSQYAVAETSYTILKGPSTNLIIIYLPKTLSNKYYYPKPTYLIIGYLDPLGRMITTSTLNPTPYTLNLIEACL